MKTPEWVKHAVFYQIFPDRFARSSRAGIPSGVSFKPWGTPPSEQGFQGGNLHGVVEKLDYLQDLGVTALYLNPVFASASNHRYHTYDYYQVDPLLGGNEALRLLLDRAHARDMRVILDGVFNHASRGFWAFHHVLEEGVNSPYIDWFTIHGWPLCPYPRSDDEPINYAAWWNLPPLPKFNIDNAGVRDHLLGVARHWIEFGADGWRLDVPEEIPNPAFWRRFREVVKSAKEDAYLVGEIWHEAPAWLRGDHFDAVMNYVLGRAVLGFCAGRTLRRDYRPGGFALEPLGAEGFATVLDRTLALYDWEVSQVQLNLLGSHDTARPLWAADGDETALRLSVLLQMTLPGAPCIYYGDEIGMTGGDDPDCRGAFPWDGQWNHELREFYKRAIRLRRELTALRTGRLAVLYAQDQCFAFQRTLEDEFVIVVVNVGDDGDTVDFAVGDSAKSSENRSLVDIWNRGDDGRGYPIRDGRLRGVRVPGRGAAVLVPGLD